MAVWIPILLTLFIPVLLATLGHGPWRIAAPGRRFKVVGAAVLSLWSVYCLMSEITASHVVAGYLILFAALMFGFMVWSVLCWGFTVAMLLALDQGRQIGSVEDWGYLYAGPGGIHGITVDRFGVLERLRLADRSRDTIEMTPSGGTVAVLAILLSKLLGLKI